MKTARSALFCLLALTAPAFIPSLPAGVAHAQDQVTTMARERFVEGVKAYDAGRYEEARTLFLQAYALKRHPAVLLNLGQSELKSGEVEAGGNHLQQFLRDHKEATEDQKKAARQGIADAQKRTGFAIVIVDSDGADVSIDGETVGKSPLLDPVFVAPGPHKVSATVGGKTASADFNAKRGTAVPVSVSFGGAAPAPAPAPVITPEPAPVVQPEPAAGYPAPLAPMGPQGPGFPPDSGPEPPRSGFVDWYVDRPVAWVLTGVAGLGIGFTAGFGIAAGVANGNAGSIADQINGELANNPNATDPGFAPDSDGDGEPDPCGDRDDPSGDLAHYRDACAKLRENLDAYDTDLIGVGVSAAIAGSAAIALVVYYFVDSGSSSSAKGRPPVLVAPVVSPSEQGVGIAGTF
jgi:hypothetical protein